MQIRPASYAKLWIETFDGALAVCYKRIYIDGINNIIQYDIDNRFTRIMTCDDVLFH